MYIENIAHSGDSMIVYANILYPKQYCYLNSITLSQFLKLIFRLKQMPSLHYCGCFCNEGRGLETINAQEDCGIYSAPQAQNSQIYQEDSES